MVTNSEIEKFRIKIQGDTDLKFREDGYLNIIGTSNYTVNVKMGQKYYKVGLGSHITYMVEIETGDIYGTLGYDKVNKLHYYGKVANMEDYFWGGHAPMKETTREQFKKQQEKREKDKQLKQDFPLDVTANLKALGGMWRKRG